MEINYFGLLRSPVSWAKVGREIVKAFIKNNDTVHVFERRGFMYDKNFPLGPETERSLVKKFISDTTLSFEHPSNYKYITSKKKFGMLVYETTAVPEGWIKAANASLDLLFVPSGFNREIFINSGMDRDKVRVVPHGVDGGVYNHKSQITNPKSKDEPVLKSQISNIKSAEKPFRFLCVAMPQKRKGLDVLLKAFTSAFGGNKDVELVIKLPYEPGVSGYDDMSIKEYYGKPGMEFITDNYTEEQMAGLYRSADCFVLASRGEGFGMAYLEALGCGVPVIATGWGGHMDFLNKDNSLLVDYSLVPAGAIQYDNGSKQGMMAEPSFESLLEKMLYIRKNSEKERNNVRKFNIIKYSWIETMKLMRNCISGSF